MLAWWPFSFTWFGYKTFVVLHISLFNFEESSLIDPQKKSDLDYIFQGQSSFNFDSVMVFNAFIQPKKYAYSIKVLPWLPIHLSLRWSLQKLILS